MSIRVHIEHLIVDGVAMSASSAVDLQAAMETRLTQLLTEHGLPHALGRTAWIDVAQAPPISLARRVDGATVGEHAAESLRAGMAGYMPIQRQPTSA
ncbi:MAG TPA: hypothetical protein VJ717_18285 [Gemmatimonadaceae bacterium]|nr:hypothetical protein [Gemmatimonadaceae bacterium]